MGITILTAVRGALGVKGCGLKPGARPPFKPGDAAPLGDARDDAWQAPNRAPSVLPYEDLSPWAPRIADQGATSSCVGQQVRMVVGCAEKLAGLAVPPPSARAAYRGARIKHGAEQIDGGTYIRYAYSYVGSYGCPGEDLAPFSALKINQGISGGALVHGFARIGLRYQFIFGNLQDRLHAIDRAIELGRPVGFGVNVTRRFQRYRGGEPFDGKLLDSDTIAGGHAMTLLGKRRKSDGALKLANSWGTDWGEGGFAWFRPEWVSEFRDIVVVEGWEGVRG